MSNTILIIDDDMHIGNMLEETLKLEGYEVLRAYSGTEALMVLERRIISGRVPTTTITFSFSI